MNSSGAGRCETNSHLASEFRIPAGHERRGFFMAHLDKPNLLLMSAERLHDSVDSIARKPEDDFHTPIDQSFNEYISSSHGTPFPTTLFVSN